MIYTCFQIGHLGLRVLARRLARRCPDWTSGFIQSRWGDSVLPSPPLNNYFRNCFRTSSLPVHQRQRSAVDQKSLFTVLHIMQVRFSSLALSVCPHFSRFLMRIGTDRRGDGYGVTDQGDISVFPCFRRIGCKTAVKSRRRQPCRAEAPPAHFETEERPKQNPDKYEVFRV